METIRGSFIFGLTRFVCFCYFDVKVGDLDGDFQGKKCKFSLLNVGEQIKCTSVRLVCGSRKNELR